MRRPRRSPLRWLGALTAVLLLVGGLALEGALIHARDGAQRRLGRRIPDVQRVLRDVEGAPTAEGHHAVSELALAHGAFGPAARHARFAAALSPGDAAAAARAERALDMAALARLRPAARTLGLLGGLWLAVTVVGALRRRRAARRRRAWVEHHDVALTTSVDGRAFPAHSAARVAPGAALVAIDAFLHRRGPPVRQPRPGPTLSIVLSHAEAGRSIRLTPMHDVRGAAARVRLRPETLEALRDVPGTWRVQARLDGGAVAETELEVGSPAKARPLGRLLQALRPSPPAAV